MGTQFSVFCSYSPSVWIILNNEPCSGIDHWLYGNNHSVYKSYSVTGLAVIRYFRVLVNLAADSVADIFANNGITAFLTVSLHGV